MLEAWPLKFLAIHPSAMSVAPAHTNTAAAVGKAPDTMQLAM
jgi:hypothetical protein